MRKPLVILAALLLLTARPLWAAQERPQPEQSPQIDFQTILSQLSADDWRAREAAQALLVDQGIALRPALVNAKKSATDPDLRGRLEAAIHQIDERDKTAPTLISLQLNNVSAAEAFARLAAISGIPIDVARLGKNPSANLNLMIDRRSFWQALLEICRQARVQADTISDPTRIVINPSLDGWSGRPAYVSGAFLFLADKLERDYALDLADPQSINRHFTMELTCFTDPRLLVLKNSAQVTLETAVDERGNSLIPPDCMQLHYEGADFRSMWEWRLRAKLHHPDGAGQRIALLKGTAHFLLRTASEKWEISDIQKVHEVSRNVGPTRITVETLTATEGGYSLRVSGHGSLLGAGTPPVSDLYEGIQRSLTLMDKDGRTFGVEFAGGGGGSEWSYSFTFSRPAQSAEPPGEPAKLIWEVPTEVRFLSIPFEFRDLPMP